MSDDFDEKDYRDAFVDAMIRTGIAFQVKAIRKREELSQKELGDRVDTPQNVISRYEDPDYGSYSIKTLKRLASAFGVALVVKFSSFAELRRMMEDRSPDALAVPSYEMEKAAKAAMAAGNSTEAEPQMVVYMSPQHAKALIEMLTTQMAVFEKMQGEVTWKKEPKGST